METQRPKEGHATMRLHSRILITLVAFGIPVLCAAVFVIRVHTGHVDTAEQESRAEPARWAFQQRAYPLGAIPDGAWMRALRQMEAARAARVAVTGDGAADGA